jgi:hypothetical protein
VQFLSEATYSEINSQAELKPANFHENVSPGATPKSSAQLLLAAGQNETARIYNNSNN